MNHFHRYIYNFDEEYLSNRNLIDYKYYLHKKLLNIMKSGHLNIQSKQVD